MGATQDPGGRSVVLDLASPVATITLSRPEKHNALRSRDWQALSDAVRSVGGDDGAKVLLIAGAGTKAFSTGADLTELRDRDPVEAYESARRIQAVCSQSANLRKPVIALLQGHTLAGGLDLALACHVRVAARTTTLGLPEVQLGLLPGAGGTQRLARLADNWTVVRMLLLGEKLSAEEARRAGFVDEVVEEEELLSRGTKLALLFAQQRQEAVSMILDCLQLAGDGSLTSGLVGEAALFGLTVVGGGHRELLGESDPTASEAPEDP